MLTFTATTELTANSGTVAIPVVVDGKAFELTFSFSVALKGAAGADGEDAYYLETPFTWNTGETEATFTAVIYKGETDVTEDYHVTLGQAYRAGVRIVTNDDGLNYLDTLEDLNKRPLLNPDPTAPNVLRLRVGATTVPITVLPNEVLATTSNKVPFIVGDLKEGIKIWDRQQTSILASNVASVTGYNAFEQRGVLYRADVRADYTELDEDAYVNGYITVTEGE